MIRLVFGLFFSLMGLGAYLAFDFWNVNRMARFGEGDGVSVSEYVSGWVSLGQMVGGADEDGEKAELPAELAAMMPRAPEGWTVTETQPGDIKPLLTQASDTELDGYLQEPVNERPGGSQGVQQVRYTYDKGPQRVIMEMVRYPNFIFTSFGAMQTKMELEMMGTKYGRRDFMVVRGMEIVEDVLPETAGVRYFMGDVSNQIWLRVIATRSLTDEDLLPFFETLHVPAMNANVIEQVAGMGEVPVIVVASALGEETLQARLAEAEAEAARQAEERAKAEAEEKAAEPAEEPAEEPAAEPAEAAPAEEPSQDGAAENEDGITVRKGIDKKGGGSTIGLGGSCREENGRKVCGGGSDE